MKFNLLFYFPAPLNPSFYITVNFTVNKFTTNRINNNTNKAGLKKDFNIGGATKPTVLLNTQQTLAPVEALLSSSSANWLPHIAIPPCHDRSRTS